MWEMWGMWEKWDQWDQWEISHTKVYSYTYRSAKYSLQNVQNLEKCNTFVVGRGAGTTPMTTEPFFPSLIIPEHAFIPTGGSTVHFYAADQTPPDGEDVHRMHSTLSGVHFRCSGCHDGSLRWRLAMRQMGRKQHI